MAVALWVLYPIIYLVVSLTCIVVLLHHDDDADNLDVYVLLALLWLPVLVVVLWGGAVYGLCWGMAWLARRIVRRIR